MGSESVLAWLRPFLLIAKFLGLFPLENVHSVGQESKDVLQFRALSAATVYSILFLPIMLGCIFTIIIKLNYWNLSVMLADDIATKCMVGIVIVSFIVSYLGMWINVSRYPAFLERLRWMEERIGVDAKEGRPLKRVGGFMLSSYAIIFLIIALGTSVDVIFHDNPIKEKVLYMTGNFTFYVLLVASLTPELIFVYMCHVLRIYSVHLLQDLSKKLKLHSTAKRDVPLSTLTLCQKISTITVPDTDSEIQISVQKARVHFVEISSLADTLSGLHSPGLLLIFLCNSVMATVTLYLGASAILREDWGVSLCGFSGAFVSLFRMGHVTLAAGNIGTQTQAKLKEISTTSGTQLSDRLSQQIILFELQMSSHPVKLTASDYFTLDKGVMTSVFGTIVTYLILLLQFRIEEAMDKDPAATPGSNSSSLASDSSHVP
ncbi:unnamed protein product [Darwinula stevensoni]|uniref:Gustatory receptor n=1 Tax=Darwinula stevensoni TaxID=69355 RepID=A0A7R8X572_9CRUS|nr:unnamed protein product [Darwinula stevensoni]CAG0885702.1 unnamed protein product [Darwinula stevensoni]